MVTTMRVQVPATKRRNGREASGILRSAYTSWKNSSVASPFWCQSWDWPHTKSASNQYNSPHSVFGNASYTSSSKSPRDISSSRLPPGRLRLTKMRPPSTSE